MGSLLGITVIAIVVYFGFRHVTSQVQQKAKNILLKTMTETEDLNFSETYMTFKYDAGMAIDKEVGRLVLAYATKIPIKAKENIKLRTINYSDILEVQLFENDHMVKYDSRNSTVGENLLRAVAEREPGIPLGENFSNANLAKRIQRVNMIFISIIINDFKSPFTVIEFMMLKFPCEKDDQKYIDAMKVANHWYNMILELMKRADKEDD